MRAEFVGTPEEAGEWLARETCEGDVVLLKASRGVKLERGCRSLDSANAERRRRWRRLATTSRHGG